MGWAASPPAANQTPHTVERHAAIDPMARQGRERRRTKGATMKNACVHLGLAGLLAATALTAPVRPAQAAVYCKYVGYPKGCVVKPGVVLAPAPAVFAPKVVYCQYVGVPAGCVARPGVALYPAPVVRGGVNRGGPVNRVGRR